MAMRRTITRNTQSMYLLIVGSGMFGPCDVYSLIRKCVQRSCAFVCVCVWMLAAFAARHGSQKTFCKTTSSMLQIVSVSRSVRKMKSNAPCTQKSHVLCSTVYLEATCALQHHNAYSVKLPLTSLTQPLHVHAQLSTLPAINATQP